MKSIINSVIEILPNIKTLGKPVIQYGKNNNEDNIFYDKLKKEQWKINIEVIDKDVETTNTLAQPVTSFVSCSSKRDSYKTCKEEFEDDRIINEFKKPYLVLLRVHDPCLSLVCPFNKITVNQRTLDCYYYLH